MKNSLIIAVVLSACVYFAPRGKSQSSPNAGYDNRANNGRLPSISTKEEHEGNQQERGTRKPNAPQGNESSQWALVFVGMITFVVIAWQAYETRRAADVANSNLSSIKTKERAKLVIGLDAWREPFYPSMPPLPQVLMTVYNLGETKASLVVAIAGIHLSTSKVIENHGSGYFPLNIDNKVMDSNERSQEAVRWAGGNWNQYLSTIVYRDQLIHLHGTIIFEDAFGDKWERKFHYIWNDYGVVVNSPPHGNIRGVWVSQGEEHENLMRPAREPNRAIQTVKFIWRKMVELSEEDYAD